MELLIHKYNRLFIFHLTVIFEVELFIFFYHGRIIFALKDYYIAVLDYYFHYNIMHYSSHYQHHHDPITGFLFCNHWRDSGTLNISIEIYAKIKLVIWGSFYGFLWYLKRKQKLLLYTDESGTVLLLLHFFALLLLFLIQWNCFQKVFCVWICFVVIWGPT